MSAGAIQTPHTIPPLHSRRANRWSGLGCGPADVPYGTSDSSGANTSVQVHPCCPPEPSPRTDPTVYAPPTLMTVTRTASVVVPAWTPLLSLPSAMAGAGH